MSPWGSALVTGLAAPLLVSLLLAGCVQVTPATDTGGLSLATPTGPSATPTGTTATPTNPTPADPGQALAYNPDVKPVFDSDCVPCHSTSRPLGRYSMSTYRDVMAAVRPGSASSALVVTTQSRGSMYRYFSGNRAAKADLVRRWVVDFAAQQTR